MDMLNILPVHQQSLFFDLNRNCSSLLYDSSKDVVQVKLPDEDQPWKENLPLYMPVDCKWNSSAKRIISRGAKEPSEDKRPKNPLGRQGVSGRGKFQHLGENAFVLPVIVRRVGDQLQVVVQENSQAPFSIPLPWIPYPSYFYEDPVGRNLTRYLHKMWLDAYEDSGHFEYFMSAEQDIIYAGPIRHKHNTDNAWLSIRFSVIDDSKYEFMSEFPSFSEFYWRNITEQELTHIKQHYVDVKKQTLL
ncbi:hypothetical protein TTRE_0000005001 [Trichuris trichiura]|uniref:Uncharacterized protein n=1 Tax=Trichuris trichiura TaxID=36087 RepID=A0A077YVK0_TRITR|nr:hypothetical protein TTRE_0000005001 [Trichuris trichiura]